MKKIKILCSVLAVSIFFVFFAFSVGVNGAWHYAMGASGEIQVPMDVMVFPWVGADQLPGDIETEHHKKLIQNILNGTYQDTNGKVVNIGLNNPDSYISNEINTRTNGNFLFSSDTLGSMDYWERNDISKYFDTETTGLTFLLHFPKNNPNEYYLYTTSMHLGESTPNIPIGETIYPIYRTVLQKNEEGVWEAVQTNTGYATFLYKRFRIRLSRARQRRIKPLHSSTPNGYRRRIAPYRW